MTDWYERSTNTLQLAGLAKSSEQSHTRMIRMLVDFYNKPPDLVSEEDLQDYLLHRRNVDKWSAATLRIGYSALKFFFAKVMHREWHNFGYLKAERPKTLPAVLSKEEIAKLLFNVRTPHNHATENEILLQNPIFLHELSEKRCRKPRNGNSFN